jgi:hypothetical protein
MPLLDRRRGALVDIHGVGTMVAQGRHTRPEETWRKKNMKNGIPPREGRTREQLSYKQEGKTPMQGVWSTSCRPRYHKHARKGFPDQGRDAAQHDGHNPIRLIISRESASDNSFPSMLKRPSST